MANFIDKVVARVAQASCSVYEDQFLCQAARGNDKRDGIVQHQEEEQARMEARQREAADIEAAEKWARIMAGAFEEKPAVAEKNIILLWDKEKLRVKKAIRDLMQPKVNILDLEKPKRTLTF